MKIDFNNYGDGWNVDNPPGIVLFNLYVFGWLFGNLDRYGIILFNVGFYYEVAE